MTRTPNERRTRGPKRLVGICLAAGFSLGADLAAQQAGNFVQLSQGQSFSTVGAFRVSNDGRLVVYSQDATVDDIRQLWGTPRGRSEPQLLSVTSDFLGNFRLTPDGRFVVYGSGSDSTVYSVSPEGPPAASVELGSMVTFDVFNDLVFGPSADVAGDWIKVPVDGPAAAAEVLSLPGWDPRRGFGAADGRAGLHLFDDPDGELQVLDLRADPVSITNVTPAGVSPGVAWINSTLTRVVIEASGDLYSVPADGPASAAVELTGGLGAGFLAFSPDGNTVLFDGSLDGSRRVYYAVPTDGPASSAVLLADSALTFGQQIVDPPGGDALLVYEDESAGGDPTLWAVPLAGGTPTALSDSDPAGSGVVDWKISPTGEFLVMQESRLADDFSRGYRHRLDDLSAGSEAIWTLLISVQSFVIAGDGREVLLWGQEENVANPPQRFWRAQLAGAADREREIFNEALLPAGYAMGNVRLGRSGAIVFDAVTQGGQREVWGFSEILTDGFESGDLRAWN